MVETAGICGCAAGRAAGIAELARDTAAVAAAWICCVLGLPPEASAVDATTWAALAAGVTAVAAVDGSRADAAVGVTSSTNPRDATIAARTAARACMRPADLRPTNIPTRNVAIAA
jgi:hypothetical protein